MSGEQIVFAILAALALIGAIGVVKFGDDPVHSAMSLVFNFIILAVIYFTLGAQFLGNFQIPPFTYYSAGANVRYALDYTGGIARSIEQRQALADYQKHELDAAYLALTGNVAIQSLTIASMRAQIRAR